MLIKAAVICFGAIVMFLAWYLSAVRFHQSRLEANEMLFKELVTTKADIDEARHNHYANLRARSSWSIVWLSLICGISGMVIIGLALVTL